MIALLAAAAAALTPTGSADAEARMVDLRRLYATSCEVRAYATYDDLCDRLKRQMREAEKAHRAAMKASAKRN